MKDGTGGLLGALIDEGGALEALFAEKDVRLACIGILRDCGVPAPGVVFWCLRKALAGAGGFIGASARSRLLAFMETCPGISKALTSILALHRTHGDSARLKAALIEGLNEEVKAELEIDEATATEVVQGVYQRQKLESIEGLTADVLELATGFRSDIDQYFEEQTRPTLTWPTLYGDVRDLSAADRISYVASTFPLFGREEETDLLQRFCGDSSMAGPLQDFRWMLITGPGGLGKTRLAMDFTQDLPGEVWDAGRLAFRDLETFDAGRWWPRKATFIVIDYPAQQPERIRDLLGALQRNCARYDWPVRVLLLEREAGGRWHDMAFKGGGGERAVLRHGFPLRGGKDGIVLGDIPESAVIALMADRFAKLGIDPPAPAEMLEAARRIDDRTNSAGDRLPPRPLFAAAAVEALYEARTRGELNIAKLVAGLKREEVLSSLIDRDREQFWRPAAGDDERLLALHENLLLLASMTLGLDMVVLRSDESEALRASLPSLDAQAVRPLSGALIKALSGGGAGRVNNLEPDILGEYFVVSSLSRIKAEDAAVAQAIVDGAFRLGGARTGEFLSRSTRDFPEESLDAGLCDITADAGYTGALGLASAAIAITYRDTDDFTLADRLDGALNTIKEIWFSEPDIALRVAMAAVNVAADAGRAGDWYRVDQNQQRLEALVEAFPHEREIALQLSMAAVNVTAPAGKAGEWIRVDKSEARLEALVEAYPDDQEIALRVAMVAVNVTNHAGEAGDRDRVDQSQARLEELVEAYPNNQEIALRVAMAALNVATDAGAAGDWDRVDESQARLEELVEAYPDDREIALQLAMAAVNVTVPAGETGDWDRVDENQARLEALVEANPDDHEIALRVAMAAVNVTVPAGEAGDWNRVDQNQARLEALVEAYPAEKEIAIQVAMAAVNITSHAGEAGDWDRVDDNQARLEALVEAYPDAQDIALRVAMAAVNAATDAGKAGDWDRADQNQARLEALVEAYPDNQDIALRVAMAAVNITSHAGEAGHWDRVDQNQARLEALVEAYPDAQDIALRVAMAAVNVASDAGKAGDWDRVDQNQARLEALVEVYPDAQEIALRVAMAAVNVTIPASKAGDWNRVDQNQARLEALVEAYPDKQEIALRVAMAAVNVTIPAGEADDWDRVDENQARLEVLAEAYPGDQEIALRVAMAAVNVTIPAGEEGGWDRVDQNQARLEALAEAFPNDQGIARQVAMAAVNVTSEAGKSGHWDRVDQNQTRLEKLVQAYPHDQEIAVRAAMARCSVHVARRVGGLLVDTSLAMSVFQSAVLVTSSQSEAGPLLGALVVLKDLRTYQPEIDGLIEACRALEGIGVDFESIPDLPPPS